MFPYYLLVFSPFIFLLSDRNAKDKKTCSFTILWFFLVLIIILSLRSLECGIDLNNYETIFGWAGKCSWKDIFSFESVYDVETGYGILNKLLYSINDNFRFTLIVLAIISLLPIMFLYAKSNKHPILTISLFLTVAPFSMFFSGIRQAFAIGVGSFLCYSFTKERKIFLFLLTVILLFFVHNSSIVLLPMYFIYHFKSTRKIIFLILLALVFIFVFKNVIFSFLISLFGRYANKYGIATESTNAFTFFALLLILGIFSFIYVDESKVDYEINGLRNLLICSIFLQCFAPVHTLAMRLNYYYLIFIPILISKILEIPNRTFSQYKNIFAFMLSSFFIVYFFYQAYFGADKLEIFPYVPFWG